MIKSQTKNTPVPKISAILPCYNHGEFLSERISSIANQTLKPSQIVFLDDCSTDDSVSIAKEQLRDLDIDVIYAINEKNSASPFAQWNQGIRLAKYNLVWIAETDDSCEATLLERLYNELSHSDAALCFAQSRQISESGRNIRSLREYTELHWPGEFSGSFSCGGGAFNTRFMTRVNAIPNASAVLFRRDAFIDAGCANPSMRYCGDWDTWIRMSEQGPFSFVSDELNLFRCHNKSTRSEAVLPRQDAEKLACKVRACLTSRNAIRKGNKSNRTNPQRPGSCLKLSGPEIVSSRVRTDLRAAISEFGNDNFFKSVKAYQALPNVPHISPLGWTAIAGTKIIHTLKRQLTRRIPNLRYDLQPKPNIH